MKLLVCDDSDEMRELIRILLEVHGYEVVTGEDGMAAVNEFMRGNFEGVILDCAMPRMDGLSAAQVIRMIESLKPDARPVRLAFLSGHYHNLDLRRIQQDVGATRVWLKPVVPEQLLADLAMWVSE